MCLTEEVDAGVGRGPARGEAVPIGSGMALVRVSDPNSGPGNG